MAKQLISADDRRASAAELVTLLLTERLRERANRSLTPAKERQIRKLCSHLLWMHSEANGKYEGCRYWSDGAWKSFKRHGKVVTKIGSDDSLLHEHLYPRDELVRRLLRIRTPTVERVARVLRKRNIGVVVTRAEDRQLDPVGTKGDHWARYRGKIRCYDCGDKGGPPTVGASPVI
jgi:hypothetical protein